jgi:DNA polymerase III delta subunit
MMYLFLGSDVGKVRAKAFAWVAAARAKAPEAPYMRIDASDMTAQALAEAGSVQGLFFTKTLVLIDDPFVSSESGDLFMENLDALCESENPIAVLAPKLLTTRAKKLEAKATKVFVCDVTVKKVERGFNSALVNALAAKDGKGLWKEIIKAKQSGDAPEAVHGLLHWKARDLMQKGSAKWGKDGARKLSRDLIELLSDARGGDLELGPALERFALSIS